MNKYSVDKIASDFLREIADKSRLLRKEKKYSQQQLAKRANVSLGSYKRFERTGQISFESLLNIAFVLGRLDDFDNLFKIDDSAEIIKLFQALKDKK